MAGTSSTQVDGAAGMAARAWSPDVWQQQMEEVMALSSIMEDDFRLLTAADTCANHGTSHGAADSDGRSSNSGSNVGDLDPADLLACGPPDSPVVIECESTVHVDVPPGGLQIMIDTGFTAHHHSSPAAQDQDAAQQPQQPATACCGATPSPAASQHSSGSQYIAFGKPVTQLPPICVHLTFPHDYPAHAPPKVQLKAMWISPAQEAVLVRALHAQWDAQGPGGPICYQWLEWLKTDALQALGIAQQTGLVLRKQKGQLRQGAGVMIPTESLVGQRVSVQDGSGGASSSSTSGAGPSTSQPSSLLQVRQVSWVAEPLPPEQLALSIFKYAAVREHELFQNETVTCPVCYDSLLGARCVRLPECGHATCRTCFVTYGQTQISSGAVDSIRCMEPSCRTPVPAWVLQAVLPPEEYKRWEELLLQRTLDRMEDLVYCPRCDTNVLEDEDHCARCPKCFYVFCGKCAEAWHPGEPCLNAEEQLARREERLSQANMTAAERARRQADLRNQFASLQVVLATSKKCPACSMAITKTEGCNKMHCEYCDALFCWKCVKVIDGYDHFRATGQCQLFDQEEVARWEAQMNNNPRMGNHWQLAAHAQLAPEQRQQLGIRLTPCVNCGQVNLKQERNNLIRCHACNLHFCYLCRTALRKNPGQHYMRGSRCKQHSDD